MTEPAIAQPSPLTTRYAGSPALAEAEQGAALVTTVSQTQALRSTLLFDARVCGASACFISPRFESRSGRTRDVYRSDRGEIWIRRLPPLSPSWARTLGRLRVEGAKSLGDLLCEMRNWRRLSCTPGPCRLGPSRSTGRPTMLRCGRPPRTLLAASPQAARAAKNELTAALKDEDMTVRLSAAEGTVGGRRRLEAATPSRTRRCRRRHDDGPGATSPASRRW